MLQCAIRRSIFSVSFVTKHQRELQWKFHYRQRGGGSPLTTSAVASQCRLGPSVNLPSLPLCLDRGSPGHADQRAGVLRADQSRPQLHLQLRAAAQPGAGGARLTACY